MKKPLTENHFQTLQDNFSLLFTLTVGARKPLTFLKIFFESDRFIPRFCHSARLLGRRWNAAVVVVMATIVFRSDRVSIRTLIIVRFVVVRVVVVISIGNRLKGHPSFLTMLNRVWCPEHEMMIGECFDSVGSAVLNRLTVMR